MASLTKKIINGRPYYYLRESAWVEGRPKVVRTTYLGRAEDIERRLAEGPGEPKAVEVRSFGAVAVAHKLAGELRIAEAIDRALGARVGGGPSVGELIELAAINRACSPRSKRQLADWHARTALAIRPQPKRALSSQRFWDAMDALDEEAIRAAEAEIVGRAVRRYEIELRPLVYDTTNFATFVDSANERNTIARRGHAKQGRRDLRTLLVQAAQNALCQKASPWHAWGWKLCLRKGSKKIAVIAIARKLTVSIWYMLRGLFAPMQHIDETLEVKLSKLATAIGVKSLLHLGYASRTAFIEESRAALLIST